MSEWKFKPDNRIKERIEKGYKAIKEAKEQGEDTSQYERQVLHLERQYIENAFRISLTKEEIDDLKLIRDVKTIFPGSTTLWTGKKREWKGMSKEEILQRQEEIKRAKCEGGETDMGFKIEAEPMIEPDVYEAKIVQLEETDGKFGKRLRVTFELPDGRRVSGYFPPKASPNNKLGLLLQKTLGEIEDVDSDSLIGLTVKVLIEHNEHNGRTFVNVSKIL